MDFRFRRLFLDAEHDQSDDGLDQRAGNPMMERKRRQGVEIEISKLLLMRAA